MVLAADQDELAAAAALALARAANREARNTPAWRTRCRRGGGMILQSLRRNATCGSSARDRDTEIIIRRSRKAPATAIEPIVDRATAIGLKVSITLS